MRKNNLKLLNVFLLIFLVFFLSSCGFINYIGSMMCAYAPNSDHCKQFVAVQTSDPSGCEKIKGTKFKKYGSNPPKDKCYLQIAENTGNDSICKNIKGGYMSYNKGECVQNANNTKTKKIDEKISEINDKIENSVDSDEINKLYNQKLKLEKQIKDSFNKMTSEQKQNFYEKKKNKILSDVKSESLKQAIAHSYSKIRKTAGGDNLKELKLLEKVKQTEVISKQLDENANKLVDSVKTTLVDMVNKKKDAVLDDAKEKLLRQAYKRSGFQMKYSLSKLEKLKNTYQKGSEYYNVANEKYEKLKAAYDKMKDIQGKLKKIDDLLSQGKLDKGKVKVLKGSILLGEGLEYATSYVPIFGDTFSTVTKETFGVVNKFATKRAIRTTSIDKCIDDPEHCDTEGISGY